MKKRKEEIEELKQLCDEVANRLQGDYVILTAIPGSENHVGGCLTTGDS